MSSNSTLRTTMQQILKSHQEESATLEKTRVDEDNRAKSNRKAKMVEIKARYEEGVAILKVKLEKDISKAEKTSIDNLSRRRKARREENEKRANDLKMAILKAAGGGEMENTVEVKDATQVADDNEEEDDVAGPGAVKTTIRFKIKSHTGTPAPEDDPTAMDSFRRKRNENQAVNFTAAGVIAQLSMPPQRMITPTKKRKSEATPIPTRSSPRLAKMAKMEEDGY